LLFVASTSARKRKEKRKQEKTKETNNCSECACVVRGMYDVHMSIETMYEEQKTRQSK
jgi:hypothetical protein